MDEPMMDLPVTGKPDGRGLRNRPTGSDAGKVLLQLEQQALQELVTARPMPDAVDDPCDALTACISWDLESPQR